ncbi:hypothetical protein [Glacieibacterium sp.]|uniref:hypothetical protein n=1 Tax=Glacieibacterium sp. TaxID=2860237 RepID=UPI003AFFB584
MKIQLIALAALLVAQPVLAHGNMKPEHGGQVQMNGETLFELATTPAGTMLYVSEDDEPVTATAMTAKLSITSGTAKQEVAMTPAAGNSFVAKGLKLAKGAKVGVMVIDGTTKARSSTIFTIK